MRTDMIQDWVLVVGVCVRPRTFIISRQLAMEYITLLRRDLHSWIEAETRSRERETDWANGMELKIAVFASFSRLQTINYLSAGGNYSAGGKDTVTITFIFPLWLTVDPHQRADLISDLCVHEQIQCLFWLDLEIQSKNLNKINFFMFFGAFAILSVH